MRLEINAQGISDLSREFSDVKPKQINLALARALNRVAALTKTKSKRAIGAQVALADRFIGEKLTLDKARSNHLQAVIRTPKRGLVLAKYKHAQAFKRGRGNKKKQAGVRVTVKRGASKVIKRAVLARGQIKLFYKGKLRTLYGPSVSQVWNKTREQIKPEITYDMDAIAAEELRFILTGERH